MQFGRLAIAPSREHFDKRMGQAMRAVALILAGEAIQVAGAGWSARRTPGVTITVVFDDLDHVEDDGR